MSDYIFDYKVYKITGKPGDMNDHMSLEERTEHLKSFGIEVIHDKFVYCKRCNFAIHYKPGQTIVFVRMDFSS